MNASVVEAVLFSETSVFSDLCRIGSLDPKVDLRFADLRGVDFSNSDLRGYDFTGAWLDGARFGNSNFDETTTFHAGQDLSEMDKLRKVDFLSVVRSFKCGNDSDRYSAAQALISRFPDYHAVAGIVLEYLNSSSENDIRRGLDIINHFDEKVDVDGQCRERVIEIAVQSVHEFVQNGISYLVEPSLTALYRQDRESARHLVALVQTRICNLHEPPIDCVRCCLDLGNREEILKQFHVWLPRYALRDLLLDNLGVVVNYRAGLAALRSYSAHYPDSEIPGVIDCLDSLSALRALCTSSSVERDRAFLAEGRALLARIERRRFGAGLVSDSTQEKLRVALRIANGTIDKDGSGRNTGGTTEQQDAQLRSELVKTIAGLSFPRGL